MNGHLICTTCLLAIRQSGSNTCPSCRNVYPEQTNRNLIAENLIGDFQVSCVDCSTNMTRKELAQHRLQCDEVIVKCPFNFGRVQCNTQFRRKDLEAHEAHIVEAHEAHILLMDSLQADAIKPIVAMLRDGLAEIDGMTDYRAKFAAAVAIERLASTDENKDAILAAGALTPLIMLLGEDGSLQLAAADALLALALDDDPDVRVLVSTVDYLLIALNDAGGSNTRVKEAILKVLMYLAGNATNRAQIIEDGAIPVLIALLKNDWVLPLKEVAIGALMSLAIDQNTAVAIVRAGAAPPLVALIRIRISSMAAVGALRTLSSHTENQVAIAKAGAVQPLLAMLKHDTGRFLAAEALRNLAHGIDQAADELLCSTDSLQVGDYVRLHGLIRIEHLGTVVNRAVFRDKVFRLVGWDSHKALWRARSADGECIQVKQTNVEKWPHEELALREDSSTWPQ